MRSIHRARFTRSLELGLMFMLPTFGVGPWGIDGSAFAQTEATPSAKPPTAPKPDDKPTPDAKKVHPLYNYEVDDKTDIAEIDYWEIKYHAIMMEDALKTKQPQGPLAVDVAVLKRNLDDYIAKHADNENLKKWQQRVKEVEKRLDPNADRSKSFKPGFLWDDNAFKQSWVSMHLAKMALADKDYDTAFMHYANAKEKLNQLLTIKDRMEDWPEEAMKWVKDMKPIADEKTEELAKKTHHN